MPRKNNKRNKHLRVYKNMKMSNFNFGEKIELTNHLIKRTRERRSDMRNLSDFDIRKKLIHEIKNSKIVGIFGKEEHRNFHGHIYVIKREHEKQVVVTYLVSSGRKQTNDIVKYQKAS